MKALKRTLLSSCGGGVIRSGRDSMAKRKCLKRVGNRCIRWGHSKRNLNFYRKKATKFLKKRGILTDRYIVDKYARDMMRADK